MNRLAVTLVAGLALVAGACGSRTDHGPAATEPVAAATGADSVDPSGGPAPGAGAAAGGADTAGALDASPAAPSDAAGAGGGAEAVGPPEKTDGEADGTEPPAEPEGIVTSVEPRCLAAPGTVTVEVAAPALADVVYAASFADGEHHGQWGLGTAGPTGEFTWTVTVPAGAAAGNTTVTAMASNVETGEGGKGTGQFQVAGEDGCP